MRGVDRQTRTMFNYVSLEVLVPPGHPLRQHCHVDLDECVLERAQQGTDFYAATLTHVFSRQIRNALARARRC